MKRITIGGKEYTFKFSVQASLYNECTEMVLNNFASGGKMAAYAKENDMESTMNELIASMGNVPLKAITLFYAGLIEYHSDEVKSIEDAKKLICKYLEENKDADGNWTKSLQDVFMEMIEIMGDDNFFGLIGLDKMIQQMMQTEEDKPKRTRRKKSEVGENTSTN